MQPPERAWGEESVSTVSELRPLGVGIHGAGNVSAEYLRTFTRNPHTAVRMITSRTVESARRRAAAFGLTCDVGDDLELLLRRDDVHLVVICTPNHLHAAEAMRAARAGKHLLVEKPIALSLEELQELVTVVQRAGVKAAAGFVLRWNPLVRLARHLLQEGTLGELVLAEAEYVAYVDSSRPGWDWKRRRAASGGAVLLLGCHAVDALRYCAGEIVAVSAYGTHLGQQVFDYPSTVVAALRFAGGAVGKVSVTFQAHSPPLLNLSLYGTRGTLRNNQLYTRQFLGQTEYATIPTVLPTAPAAADSRFQLAVDDFVACVLEDREPVAGLTDAAVTHEVCLAIERSLETGRPVALPLLRGR